MMARGSVSWAVLGGVVLWSAAVLIGARTVEAQGGGKSVNDGVYTGAQATRGQSIYDGSCATCHEPGRFTGAEFVKAWAGQPLGALFTAVSTTMPEDNPGSLKPQQYADVIAYFLRLNGYATGSEELAGTPEAMKGVLMEAKKP